VRGRLCAADGDYVCAANQLMNANAAPRYKHNDLIWGYMGRASGYAAIRLASSATTDADSAGWWRLKADLLQCHSTREQWDLLAAWRMAWPDHPANLRPPLAVQGIDAARWQPHHIGHIGLLLPLSGGLSRAGRAIRDGFIAAYLSRSDTPAEPGAAVAARVQISFYDSQAQPLPQLYERVLTDGVDFLIGPLQKELVAELNALNPEIPTLALNYLDSNDQPSANLLQLGLVIEDEAHTIGQRMQADGIENLLLLHTYDEWSLRAKRELESQWQGPITIQSFTDIKTITEAVGVAMNVSRSQARHQALSDAFSFDLEFLPRARHDLHGIIALVDNVEANALVPALRFHFAQDLPVYASSQSIRGARAAELSELEGFRISELPWHLFDDPLYRTIDETFGLAENPFSSLYALGVDALRVSERISSLDRSGTSQMLGSTGVLALLADGKFRRELTWGVVRRSSLRPLDF
jgi:outer membrane PBP1 activator LpoA protein